MLATGAAVLLILMLAVARVIERARERRAEAGMNVVLSGDPTPLLAELWLPVRAHRLGLGVCTSAREERNPARLRRGVAALQAVAPSLIESLREARDLVRSASAVVVVPAPSPRGWRVRRVRGLAALAAVLHLALVGAWERLALRVWFLGRALMTLLARVSAAAAAPLPNWSTAEGAEADLVGVGDAAADTLERVGAALARRRLTLPSDQAHAPVSR